MVSLLVVAMVVGMVSLSHGSLVLLFNSSGRCLDGSPPAMSVILARHPSPDWIVEFEGGAWCSSWSQCEARSSSRLGSSKLAAPLSSTSPPSRHFASFNRARVHYCDGASFLSSAGPVSRQERTLHFSGRAVARAAVSHLMTSFGLGQAGRVLLTGCSAGGVAALALADELREMVGEKAETKVLADSPVFPMEEGSPFAKEMREMAELHRLERVPDFFRITETMTTPFMLLQSTYDHWCFRNILVPPAPCFFSNCTLAQKQHLTAVWHAPLVEKLLRHPPMWRARNGFFLHSSCTHCARGEFFSVNGVGHDVAVAQWFFNVATVSRYVEPAWSE